MPFTDELNIISKNFITILIFNSKGELLGRSEGNGNVLVNTSQWSPGIYFLKAIGVMETKNYKLIKN